jgi:hypothetical protein
MEYNLFWVRIMKEHAIFIEASLPPTLPQVTQQADYFRKQFSVLLAETIRLSGGVVPWNVIQSAQFYTKFTEAAEETVQHFTGINTDSDLTQAEYSIAPLSAVALTPELEQSVAQLNGYILNMVRAFTVFQSELLENQTACRIVTFLYTSGIAHIVHEAQRYIQILTALQNRDENFDRGYAEFWNDNMAGHSKTMRGLFDPSETAFFREADRYAVVFDALATVPNTTTALPETRHISEFKATATSGLLSCKIKSLMNPLFTDHLLREANHYLWLMQG